MVKKLKGRVSKLIGLKVWIDLILKQLEQVISFTVAGFETIDVGNSFGESS